jgi:AraC-like DNA-binding protein
MSRLCYPILMESESEGLWRAILAGPGGSLADAFANVDGCPEVERVLRYPQRGLLSARVTLKPLEGQGYWELTRIRDDFLIIIGNFSYKSPRLELVPGDGLVQFNFRVSGDLTYLVSRTESLRFNRPAFHIWRQPQGVDMHELTKPSTHERLVAISVRPEFLLELFANSEGVMPERLRAFAQAPDAQVNFWQMPLTADMFDLTDKLLRNPHSGPLWLLNTEGLALQLLCTAVANIGSLPETPTEEYSQRELACLQSARQILMRRFTEVPSVPALAKEVGLGEKALARGFKAVYGESPFDFSLRCRLQQALTLLRDRQWSVDRVAQAVGYAHSTSFTTAFRRHFGLRPIDLKRVRARGK